MRVSIFAHSRLAEPSSRRGTGILISGALLAAAFLTAAKIPQSPIVVQISAADVPPGAMAQIRLSLPAPRQIAGGSLVMDLDASIFGPIAGVDVFSVTGDQTGVANIRGRRFDVKFSSSSGGIGQFPGMPAITVLAPVLATAKPGDTGSITLTAGDTPWKDVQGNQFLPAAQMGRLKVGGSLSIDSVTPGGGLLPAGATVRIAGRGFTASTLAQIEGVTVSSTAFTGPQAIDVKLGAPADLAGKRVRVRNPDGTQADFYSALRLSVPERLQGLVVQPIFPIRTYAGAYVGRFGTWFALGNQTPEPVDVVTVVQVQSLRPSVTSTKITIPAGAIYTSGPSFIANHWCPN